MNYLELHKLTSQQLQSLIKDTQSHISKLIKEIEQSKNISENLEKVKALDELISIFKEELNNRN